jgi:hypothetical protein
MAVFTRGWGLSLCSTTHPLQQMCGSWGPHLVRCHVVHHLACCLAHCLAHHLVCHCIFMRWVAVCHVICTSLFGALLSGSLFYRCSSCLGPQVSIWNNTGCVSIKIQRDAKRAAFTALFVLLYLLVKKNSPYDHTPTVAGVVMHLPFQAVACGCGDADSMPAIASTQHPSAGATSTIHINSKHVNCKCGIDTI